MIKEGVVILGKTVPADGGGVSDAEIKGEVYDSHICKTAAEEPKALEDLAVLIEEPKQS